MNRDVSQKHTRTLSWRPAQTHTPLPKADHPAKRISWEEACHLVVLWWTAFRGPNYLKFNNALRMSTWTWEPLTWTSMYKRVDAFSGFAMLSTPHPQHELKTCPNIQFNSAKSWDPTKVHFSVDSHLLEEEVERIWRVSATQKKPHDSNTITDSANQDRAKYSQNIFDLSRGLVD